MKRTPRRQRGRPKSWVYLALFGVDDEPEQAKTDETTSPESGDEHDTASSEE